MSDVRAWLWYANVLGVAANNAGHVLRLYPTPEKLMQAGEYLRRVLTPMQYETMCGTTLESFVNTVHECERLDVKILTFDSPDYPKQLTDNISPPPVLYYRGDITLLRHSLLFAIIGTRRPSAYGVEATRKISEALSESGAILVSGLATGLDSEAHKMALKSESATVACLAFGHDICYPASNRSLKELIEKTGVTVSEYPPGTEIHKGNFLNRNRIIASLSRGVCVAEARKASGTMNTVAHALNMGRDIFAVPGSIFSPLSEGTNLLLAQGANFCTSGEDVLNFYAFDTRIQNNIKPELTQPDISENAKLMFKFLSPKPKTAEILAADCGLKTNEAMAALTELELCGAARQLSGRRFELAEEIFIDTQFDMTEMYF